MTRVQGGMGEGKENSKRRMRDALQLEEVPLCGREPAARRRTPHNMYGWIKKGSVS